MFTKKTMKTEQQSKCDSVTKMWSQEVFVKKSDYNRQNVPEFLMDLVLDILNHVYTLNESPLLY